MNIIIHPLAQREFERQIIWLKQHGLEIDSAQKFHNEIRLALDDLAHRSQHRPLAQTPSYLRVGPTPKFRFSVIYKIVSEKIHVVAFAAPQRRPGYWKRRQV